VSSSSVSEAGPGSAPSVRGPAHRDAPWADRLRAEARNHPGVYRFLGPRGEVLYVGKSVQVRTRLLSWLRGDDRKSAELLRVTHDVTWDYTGSEFDALLLEFRLIRALRPRFNVVHRRDRRFAWIRLTPEAAPRLVATLRPGAGGSARGGRRTERIFGPFPARRSLPRDLAELAATVGLRDCAGVTPMIFADQMSLWAPELAPGCARAELGSCPAPCAAGCSESAYQARVLEAVAFLEGRSDAPLATLEARMREAARREAFEIAARCRDRMERLARLRDRITETRRRIEELSFVYETGEEVEGEGRGSARGAGTGAGRGAGDRANDAGSTRRHHLVRQGQVLLSFDPAGGTGASGATPAARARLALRIREALRAPTPPLADLDDEAREELFLVTRWFRSHPEEKTRTTPITRYIAALKAGVETRLPPGERPPSGPVVPQSPEAGNG
jgi:excinuclease ABC subunit C